MKTYLGVRVDGIDGLVLVDGEPLAKRFDLACHRPGGFQWGRRGSHSKQLALAILADAVGEDLAMEFAEAFAVRVVAGLGEEWRLTLPMIVSWVIEVAKRRTPAAVAA